MTVGIVKNKTKKQSEYYALRLEEAFRFRGIDVIVAGRYEDCTELYNKSDIVISIGGDGTFLRVASNVIERGIPVFGFNLGTLGFLTEFDKEKIDDTVEKIASGKYETEERIVLKNIVIHEDGSEEALGYALNDCVAARENASNLAYINVKINGIKVDTYPCDGIIVSTQTGSTAYSLSAGGPIVEPGNNVTLITPICSHAMGSRTIVARASSTVELSPSGKTKKLCVNIDGKPKKTIVSGEKILCKAAEEKVKIIRIDPPNFYTAVQKKLLSRNLFSDEEENQTDA